MNRRFSTSLALFRPLQTRVQESSESISRTASRARCPTGLGLRLTLSLIGLLVLAAGTASAQVEAPLSQPLTAGSVSAAARNASDLDQRPRGVEVLEDSLGAWATGLDSVAQDSPMAAVDVCGNITENRTWSLPVYHVTCPTYVLEGATLTIDPGTVVKFGNWNGWRNPTGLSVLYGTLYAIGTETDPVVFTSYWDDAHGGDTNGDGSATTPEPGDWYGVWFQGPATGRIQHAWIGYGGSYPPSNYGMVTVKSDHNGTADVLLDHVTLTKAYASNGAIVAVLSNVIVRRSEFLDNGKGVYDVAGGSIIDARHNWWGYPTGPNGPGNPLGEGDAIDESVLYYPWVGDLSTYGKLPATFRLSGPNTASPGGWADYTISFRSSPTEIIEDAVVVLTLPRTSDYIQSTEGGIFWPERHQVFWKLGDLPPGTEGQLTATAEFLWGIPEGATDGATAVLAGSNWGQDQLDAGAYLAYQPRELLGRTPLTEGEFSAERAAYPDVDLLYTRAISDGFVVAEVSRLAISNQQPITQATLIHEERSEVMYVRRMSDTVSGATFGPMSYGIADASGGTSIDFQLQTLASWGSWAGSTLDAGIQAACSPTKGDCFLNCLGDNAPAWLLKNIAKAATIILGSYDCFTCFRGNDASCEDCATNLVTKIPGIGEIVDATQCYRDCDADPTSHTCSESKSYCDRSKTNPVTLFVPAIEHLRCDDDCKYRWPPTPEYGPVGKVCKDCTGGPRFLDPGECCGDDNQAISSSQRTDTVIQQSGTCNSSYCQTQITIAHDPNAKHGISGAVLPGQRLTYTIEYENEGEGYAYGVFLVDPLDEGLDGSTLSIRGDGTYLSGTRDLIWDIGDLAPSGSPGSTSSVSFTVAVSDGLPSGTPITNEALVVFQSVPEETPTNAVVNVVQPVVALPQSVETSYVQAVSITLEGVEVSGAPLTYAVVSGSLFGELEGTPPQLTYTPMADFVGQDAFSFEASNGISTSLPARVQIRVQPSAADTTPPEVRWSSPGEGEVIEVVSSTPVFSDSIGPAYGPSILVQFSEMMSTTTVSTDTVQLTRGGGSPVPISVSYEGWTNRAAIVQREPWRTSGYTVTLSTGIEDASGNALASEVVWGFGATAPEPSDRLYLPLLMK